MQKKDSRIARVNVGGHSKAITDSRILISRIEVAIAKYEAFENNALYGMHIAIFFLYIVDNLIFYLWCKPVCVCNTSATIST